MANWRKLEKKCTKYLQKEFGEFAEFVCEGSSDSTKPDISVKPRKTAPFCIEVKSQTAQCGQFVLFPDMELGEFIYSGKNKTNCNEYAKQIIKFMNIKFEVFKNVDTKGEVIEFPEYDKIFFDWIKAIYQDKNVKFIMTRNNIILPLEKINNYFFVTAHYRIKKSGSGDVGKRKIDKVKEYILKNYSILSIEEKNSKLFVVSKKNIDKEKFVFDDYNYMFAQRGNMYEVRKLSNTNHANVIFSIKLKNDIDEGLTKEEFIKYLIK